MPLSCLIINWNKCGKKSSVSNVKNYLEISLDGLRRTTRELGQNSRFVTEISSRDVLDTKRERSWFDWDVCFSSSAKNLNTILMFVQETEKTMYVMIH